jgi:alkylation response protein AidB-like acyl-CoA dehydrogenase
LDFGLSEEQKLLQDTVKSFAADRCPAPRLRELFEAGAEGDAALWQGLAELGVAGLAVPEGHGGAGLEILDLALAAEALGHAAFPGPFLGHALAGLALGAGGSRTQQERWLPKLATGEVVGALALGEVQGGFEPEAWTPVARAGRLTGAKAWVPCAGAADLFVVGTAGGALVLVERDAPGLEIAPVDGIDRTRPLSELRFAGAPCEPLAGGAAAVRRVRDAGLVLLAADAFGAAEKLLELAVAYAQAREQFGQPIAQFQAVKHQLANLATAIEPMRALVWYAAHAQDHVASDAERSAAIAKAHVTDQALDAAREVVQLHGGLGFTWDCDVQIWLKRAIFDRAFLGTPELHRERQAALGGW